MTQVYTCSESKGKIRHKYDANLDCVNNGDLNILFNMKMLEFIHVYLALNLDEVQPQSLDHEEIT